MTSLRGAHPVILSVPPCHPERSASVVEGSVTPSRSCHPIAPLSQMLHFVQHDIVPHQYFIARSVSGVVQSTKSLKRMRKNLLPVHVLGCFHGRRIVFLLLVRVSAWFFRMTLPIFPSHPGFGPYFPDDNSCYAIRRFQNATGATQGSPTSTIVDK